MILLFFEGAGGGARSGAHRRPEARRRRQEHHCGAGATDPGILIVFGCLSRGRDRSKIIQ